MVAKKTAAKKTPAKTTAATKGTDKKLNTLEKKIGKVPKFFRELTTKEPEMFNLVMRFEQHIWDDGKLSRKTKKLIAIAIAAALRDQHAVRAQLPVQKILESPKQRSKRRSALPSSCQVCPLTSMEKHSSMRSCHNICWR